MQDVNSGQPLLEVLDSSYGSVDVEAAAAASVYIRVRDAREARTEGDENASIIPADGVLVQYANITAEVMDANPTWKVIGRYGVGVDTIDLAAASARSIAVVNVPDYCEEEVATHAAALVLDANRRITAADALVRRGEWADWAQLRPIAPLSTATLSLIGVGRIGREVIRLMRPFVGRIIAHDPYAGAIEGVELVDLDTALAEGDVVSLHLPLSAATHHLIGADAIARMKPTATLVNVSRGGLVDGAALAAALHDGRLASAALDVLETEPPAADDPLLAAPNTIITNHLAWYSEASEQRLRARLAERCAAVLRGRDIPSLVNRQGLADAAGAASSEAGRHAASVTTETIGAEAPTEPATAAVPTLEHS
ncbi:D-3-phosphoglycerate dehydrogenase [Agromyces terreus]|uniref:D-3-phosphoglycerate dehydrogenase n=1 Tax=Agromyces terreus TaxID=424795 RepID=A0A9X2KC07_9MICO|nr:C-terminal binding protein [Agromyces terreus]MCP2370901.1 D-3-phosphoglycerate dehydrogenase [Agromyces terreus]